MSLAIPLNHYNKETSSTDGNDYMNHDEVAASSPSSWLTSIKVHRIIIGVVVGIALVLLLALIYTIMAEPSTPKPVSPVNPLMTTAVLLDIANRIDKTRNLSVDPCDDFYHYACDGWIAQTTLPPGKARIARAFDETEASNTAVFTRVVQNHWPIIGPYYESCMNTDKLTRLGITPIQHLLDITSPLTSPIGQNMTEFMRLAGQLRTLLRQMNGNFAQETGLLIIPSVVRNPANTSANVLALDVGGTTMRSRNMYFGPNNTVDKLQTAIQEMFKNVGDNELNAGAWAAAVVNIELAIANISLTGGGGGGGFAQQSRRRLALTDLVEMTSALNIDQYLHAAGYLDVMSQAGMPLDVYISNNTRLQQLNMIIQTNANDIFSVSNLLAYARWYVINQTYQYLSPSLSQTYFQHFGKPIDGILQQVDRTTFCVSSTVQSFPDIIGRFYLQTQLDSSMQETAETMISWIQLAFEQNLPAVSWMDNYTRQAALEKARMMYNYIGGPPPQDWLDYSTARISKESYYWNHLELRAFATSIEMNALVSPNPVRLPWPTSMTSITVNAQYNRMQNSITFPAAILQTPFFNASSPMAMNLGSIGMVVGHEILHGFDNSGREYDGNGTRREWWPTQIVENFIAKASCLIYQYGNMTVQGYQVNGMSTLGENIADNGGLHMSFLAYQNYLATLPGKTEPMPPSNPPLTPNQLFFFSHAQTWCTVASDAGIQNQILNDAHAPGETRVRGPLRNSPDFAAAFNCPLGSKMNPIKKCDLY